MIVNGKTKTQIKITAEANKNQKEFSKSPLINKTRVKVDMTKVFSPKNIHSNKSDNLSNS